jgi:hypothetical protein
MSSACVPCNSSVSSKPSIGSDYSGLTCSHVKSGVKTIQGYGAPVKTPDESGIFYLDITTNTVYMSVDGCKSGKWVQLNTGSSVIEDSITFSDIIPDEKNCSIKLIMTNNRANGNIIINAIVLVKRNSNNGNELCVSKKLPITLVPGVAQTIVISLDREKCCRLGLGGPIYFISESNSTNGSSAFLNVLTNVGADA